MNTYGFGKIKLCQILLFSQKSSLNSVFYDNEIIFHSESYRDLILGRNCFFFTRTHVETKNSLIAYCSSHLVPTKAFACICVHIFCTIYEGGVLAQGGGERIIYGRTQ